MYSIAVLVSVDQVGFVVAVDRWLAVTKEKTFTL